MKKLNAPLERFNSDLWHFHIKVNPEINEYYKSKKIKRLIATIGTEKIHCAILSAGYGIYFININKELR